MNEMIERVALAISGGDDPASVLGIHRSRARLAIEAMREPTEAMQIAGQVDPSPISTDAVWRAMIDEVLRT